MHPLLLSCSAPLPVVHGLHPLLLSCLCTVRATANGVHGRKELLSILRRFLLHSCHSLALAWSPRACGACRACRAFVVCVSRCRMFCCAVQKNKPWRSCIPSIPTTLTTSKTKPPVRPRWLHYPVYHARTIPYTMHHAPPRIHVLACVLADTVSCLHPPCVEGRVPRIQRVPAL